MEEQGDAPDSVFPGNFDELLTEQVRTHPAIYNTRDELFKSPARKEEMWRQIADTLDVSVDICCSRWRTLRESYVRKKKAITKYPKNADRITRYWPLFSEIEEFLSPFITHRRKSGIRHRPVVDLKNEDSESKDFPSASPISSVKPKRKRAVIRRRDRLAPVSQHRRLRRRHQEALDTDSNSHNAEVVASQALAAMPQPLQEDEEGHFGHIVAATLRRLTPRQRAHTKLVIYQVLVDAEFPLGTQDQAESATASWENTSSSGFPSLNEPLNSPYIQVPKLETE